MSDSKKLILGSYFSSPVYCIELPEYLKDLNKVSDKYIKKVYKEEKIKKYTVSYHSESMINDKKIHNFKSYVGQTAANILDYQGYDISNHELFFTEMWVQEFSKKVGGHHKTHVHGNNHISGFYFLKCSENTSMPVFHDPRPGKAMTYLPEKNKKEVTLASKEINFKVKPGTLIFFNSYLPHQFPLDYGIDPFRFIHFNLQAVSKSILTNT